MSEPDVFKHFGWPKPPALLPIPPAGFSVMSKTMLWGRVASPLTPPTPARGSSLSRFRTRQVMLWSAQAPCRDRVLVRLLQRCFFRWPCSNSGAGLIQQRLESKHDGAL